MVNGAGADVPAVVVTVMLAVPEFTIKLAGTAAVSCVGLTYVVPREAVPHMEVAAEVKAVPLMVSINPAPPAVTEAGVRLVIVGSAGLMAMTAEADQPP
jgi:hypothetical protein